MSDRVLGTFAKSTNIKFSDSYHEVLRYSMSLGIHCLLLAITGSSSLASTIADGCWHLIYLVVSMGYCSSRVVFWHSISLDTISGSWEICEVCWHPLSLVAIMGSLDIHNVCWHSLCLVAIMVSAAI